MNDVIPFPVQRTHVAARHRVPTLEQVSESIARLQGYSYFDGEFSGRVHWQLEALIHGLKMLSPEQRAAFPLLSAALANMAIAEESGRMSGTTSRNDCVTPISSCA